MEQIILELADITKSFGTAHVLRGVNIQIFKGEFITFLGSSGCGKTTMLRIIAGLETPDRGQVLLSGKDITHLEPHKRDVNTVFQNYALFPHMNVAQNIGYGPRLKRTPKEAIRQAVEEVLDLVQLPGYEKRMPSELSGGQRQRVAIARALVNRPQVLLLDEPLGALDLQLRRQMQMELKHLQQHLGITFLYITHDQDEALNMSDRIVVMRNGLFEQVGTPAQVYHRPRTSFVARFIDNANILQGIARPAPHGLMSVELPGGSAPLSPSSGSFADGEPVTLAVRSEHIQFDAPPQVGSIPAVVKGKNFTGGMLRITFTLSDGAEVVASRHGIDLEIHPGQKTFLSWDSQAAVVVEREALP